MMQLDLNSNAQVNMLSNQEHQLCLSQVSGLITEGYHFIKPQITKGLDETLGILVAGELLLVWAETFYQGKQLIQKIKSEKDFFSFLKSPHSKEITYVLLKAGESFFFNLLEESIVQ